MKIYKTLTTSATVLALSVFANCTYAAGELIGIALPNKTEARWIMDGNNIVKNLKAKGYKTDLQYSTLDVPTQISQIENMITSGAKVLVVAPVDGATVSNVLHKAKLKGIKVISYDKLITKTADVDYYATFDNYQVGVLQGTSIVKKLGLDTGKGPFNIELFAGSLDDNNAHMFNAGAMSVLNPYIAKGKLVVRSKQTALAKVATLRWEGATAQARMDNLLSAFYGGARVNAVLAPNDNLATGIISSLKGVGYGRNNQPMPVITGQDAQPANIKAIIKGDQTSTVFKDTRLLASAAANMVDAIIKGHTVYVNNKTSYNNGSKVVPTYLVKPQLVDKNNWYDVLVKSGYYTANQLK
ncbi:sugar ABC transporter substrate-binding protein [Acinetobacter sp. ANC 4635]|uniref:multiple monosaccharide ABC transporter substrate-binding protein n=1 Tax=Acinetobacter sp. ANC 4635 TaxID=2529846 RepID=UPI00103E5BB7|nr:multiple monosaccharide ABC transporter substrate-binding protein [Acinetobacter sp. ANC 4635]TCB24242.1 sugar ABC transporter substrate-binding protein [Acinetobacter sp. ANC 4635]